jgi:hypothetical protein
MSIIRTAIRAKADAISSAGKSSKSPAKVIHIVKFD